MPISIKELENNLQSPPKEYRPYARWWWFGNEMTPEDLSYQLNGILRQEFGGVEIQSIYSAKGGSPHLNTKELIWLDNIWVNLVKHAVTVAKSLDLRVDITFGNGWPFGGPNVPKQHTSAKLKKKKKWKLIINTQAKRAVYRWVKPHQNINAIFAHKLRLGSRSKPDLCDITRDKHGTFINWLISPGIWIFHVYYTGQTRQKVKRSAPGGNGYVMDHLDHKAFDIYKKDLERALKEGLGPNLGDSFGAFFCDSWEVYGENWTRELLPKFLGKTGYDLAPFLREVRIGRKLGAKSNRIELKHALYDYRKVHGELIYEEFFQHFSNYCHEMGVQARVQPYMAPTDLLKAYGTLDILEVEGFGKHGINTLYYGKFDPRIASSAAHIYNKSIVSCESFTWLGEHFSVSLEQLKGEADQIFLNGVSRIIYHGFSGSPKEAGIPGRVFYASINANPTNPWWPYLHLFNRYLTRNSWIIRNTTHIADFAVYVPYHDEWMGNEKKLKELRIALRKAGLFTNFDYINDDRLLHAVMGEKETLSVGTGRYQYLIIWNTTYLPLAIAQKLKSLVSEGLNLIIFGDLPQEAPGIHALRENQSSEVSEIFNTLVKNKDTTPSAHLASISELPGYLKSKKYISDFEILPTDNWRESIDYLHHQSTDGDLYFIVNKSHNEFYEIPIILKGSGDIRRWDTMDCRSSSMQYQQIDGTRKKIELSLNPLESTWILIGKLLQGKDKDPEILKQRYRNLEKTKRTIHLEHDWHIYFHTPKNYFPEEIEGDFILENSPLFNWTENPATKYFAGTAVYTRTVDFTLEDLKNTEKIIINLGKVREIAEIIINDQKIGSLWWGKREIEIKNALHEGPNEFQIKITNLLLNKVIGFGKQNQKWKPKYFFVNAKYLPFKPGLMSPLPSGLIGPVVINFRMKPQH